jgi:hypothetical protein
MSTIEEAARQPGRWPEAAAVPRERTRAEEALERADEQFFDDLMAAHRFKTFLVSAGVEVPSDVSQGIAELLETFAAREPESAVSAARAREAALGGVAEGGSLTERPRI